MHPETQNMTEANDPWGLGDNESKNTDIPLEFKDSFTPVLTTNTTESIDPYVPLDDSAQYLSSLEKKLSRVQGKNPYRRNETKSLIDGLAACRSLHNHQLVQADASNSSEISDQHMPDLPSDHSNGILNDLMKKLPSGQPISVDDYRALLLNHDFLTILQEQLANENSSTEGEQENNEP